MPVRTLAIEVRVVVEGRRRVDVERAGGLVPAFAVKGGRRRREIEELVRRGRVGGR